MVESETTGQFVSTVFCKVCNESENKKETGILGKCEVLNPSPPKVVCHVWCWRCMDH